LDFLSDRFAPSQIRILFFPYLKKGESKLASGLYFVLKTRNGNRVYLINTLRRFAEKMWDYKNLSNHIARHSFGISLGTPFHPYVAKNFIGISDFKTDLMYQANFNS